MRITEKRLRRVIRQVIKEAAGDYDATDMSSRIRNKSVEDKYAGSYTDRRMAKAQARQAQQQQAMAQQQGMQSYRGLVVKMLKLCQSSRAELKSCSIRKDLAFTDDPFEYNSFQINDFTDSEAEGCRNIAEDICGCLGLEWSELDDDSIDALTDAVLYALEHADHMHGQHSCLEMINPPNTGPYILELIDQEKLVDSLCNPATQKLVR